MEKMRRKRGLNVSSVVSVALLLFAAHAGGGFATGNQVNTYFVGLGWAGIVSILVSMALLMGTIAVCMSIYNKNNFKSYKEVFDYVFHPYEKLTFFFELFFTIMVLMVISSSVSGSASALSSYLSMDYLFATVATGALILLLTIFGADLVRKVGSFMGIVILFTALAVYFVGALSGDNVFLYLGRNFQNQGLTNLPRAIGIGVLYAGFQCVQIPGMLPCSTVLESRKEVRKSMGLSALINSLALILSFSMLLSWKSYYETVEAGTTLPTLTATNAMGYSWMSIFYAVTLVLCLLSSAVTITFGLVNRLENNKLFAKIDNILLRRAILALLIILVSTSISTVGLTNIVKYGYGYCGYLGIAIAIVPMLTVGLYKLNKDSVSEVFEQKELLKNQN